MSLLPSSLFEAAVPGLGRPLTDEQGVLLDKYLNILIKWQRTHRLVGSVEPDWLVHNVVLHSLAFLEAVPADALVLADIGSGAGIPGVPIAIVRPDIAVTLVEPRQRRASFLSTVIRELRLTRASIVSARVESLGEEYVDRFDAALMRCAGPINAMLAAVWRLVRTGGVVIVSAHSETPPTAGGGRVSVNSGPGHPPWGFDRIEKR